MIWYQRERFWHCLRPSHSDFTRELMGVDVLNKRNHELWYGMIPWHSCIHQTMGGLCCFAHCTPIVFSSVVFPASAFSDECDHDRSSDPWSLLKIGMAIPWQHWDWAIQKTNNIGLWLWQTSSMFIRRILFISHRFSFLTQGPLRAKEHWKWKVCQHHSTP